MPMIDRRAVMKSGMGAMLMAAQSKDQNTMTSMDAKAAIDETRARVFTAYRAGDVGTMMDYFHPDVIQIPAFERVLDGKAAVEANYRAILSAYSADLRDTLENLSIAADMASTHGLYDLTLTPKDGSAPMIRSGRYMVIMKRWPDSPTGWSTFRELVQPGD